MDECEAKVASRVDNVARSVAKISWEQRSRSGNFAQEFECLSRHHSRTALQGTSSRKTCPTLSWKAHKTQFCCAPP